MSNALKDAQPVRVAITNVRKDGERFLNIVTMHPVFDRVDGAYSYVVSVLFELRDDETFQ
jgi:hypothetical protein